MYKIGIDLGGTTIGCGIVNTHTEIVAGLTIATGANNTGDELVEKIASACRKLMADRQIPPEEIEYIGIGVPGTANLKTGEIEDANNLGLDKYPFQKELEKRIQKRVYFENDANTAALGEYYLQKLTAESFFMVTLGTGVGGGYIVNQKIMSGINGALGEIGHMVIERNGRRCSCGRRGCFECYASSRALVTDTIKIVKQKKRGILWELGEEKIDHLDGKQLFEAYRMGDEAAVSAVEQYTDFLGEGIVNIINILQPQILCIGGGISQAGDCYFEQLKTYVKKYRYSQNAQRNTQMILAEHGNDAGIVGAAMLGKNGENQGNATAG